jgi:clathrin heavy chain
MALCTVNKQDQLLRVNADVLTVIPYIPSIFHNTGVAFKLASWANVPGAEYLYVKQRQRLFLSGSCQGCSEFGQGRSSLFLFSFAFSTSLKGILWTVAVIESFKQAPTLSGGLSPILQYFNIFRV